MQLAFVPDGAIPPRTKLCCLGVEPCITADERTCFRLVAEAESFACPVCQSTRIGGYFNADDIELEILESPRDPTDAEALFVTQNVVEEDEVRASVPTEM